jgi:RHS repeat-associated protein
MRASGEPGDQVAVWQPESSNAEIAEEAEHPSASQEPADTSICGQHVDMATGEYVLPASDLDLPAVLPLRLTRTHRSGFRHGVWLGPSWSCTFDTRVLITDDTVMAIDADGVILAFDHPVGDKPRFARRGRPWRLWATPTGGYRLQPPNGGRTYYFEPKPHLGGADLDLGVLFISAITDPHRNRILFSYNDSGVPSSVEHSAGYRIGVDCDGHRIRGYVHHTGGVLRRFGYTGGDLTSAIDAVGGTSRFGYDDAHRMVTRTDSNDVRYTNIYDASGRVVAQGGVGPGTYTYRAHPDGNGSVGAYADALGATTVYGFDADLRPRAVADPTGRITRTDFNIYRDPLSITDPAGAVTRFLYTPDGDLAEVTDPLGATTRVYYTDIDGRRLPTRVVGPEGAETQYNYDSHGNRVEMQDPAGGIWHWEFQSNGAVGARIDPMGRRVDIDRNPAGQPVARTDALGGQTRFAYDDFGRITDVTDPSGATTTLTYDRHGRLVSRVAPDGAAESWTYDGEGNRIAHTDAVGATTRWEYGPFDLLTARMDTTGSRTRYDYDPARRLVSVTNPAGLAWSYRYGLDGQLFSETDFNGATTDYGYDRAGRLASRTNAAGQMVSYSYDLAGRLVAESSGVVSGQAERSSNLFGGESVAYKYDPAGRLVSTKTPSATSEFARDPAGRVIKETVGGRSVLSVFNLAGDLTEVTSPAGVDTVLAYDARGTIESISVAGQRCDITSDPAGRPTRYQYGSTAIDSAYDPAGRLTRRAVTTGIRDLSVLDLSGRRAAEQLLAAGDYAYGPTGALATVVGLADPAVIALGTPARYATDVLGRLVTRTTESVTETVRFDAAENPTTTTDAGRADSESSAATPWHYAGVRLLDDGRARYHYDPAGRLTQVLTRRPGGDPEIWYYAWDAWDRLRTVTTPDHQTYHYTYDPAGRRITKQGPDTRTRFTWFGSRQIEQANTSSTGGATAEVTAWSYLPGCRTPQTQTHAVVAAGAGSNVDDGPARPLRAGELNLGANRRSPVLPLDEVSRRLYAIVCDHIDTPVVLLDVATGEIAGHVTSSTIWGLARWIGIDTPWRYPGHYHDPETGLHYNVNGFYQPATGRSLNPAALGSAAVIKTDC